MRRVPIVSARWRSPTARTEPSCACARLLARSVSRPRTTSRKCADSRDRARQRARVRASRHLPDEDHEHGDQRHRGRHDHGGREVPPAPRSGRIAAGTATASTTCGRYREKKGSSASTPDVAAATTSPWRAPWRATGRERSSAPVTRRRRSAAARAAAEAAGEFRHPRQQRARERHGRQRGEGDGEVPQAGAVGDARGDDVRREQRLRHDARRRQQAGGRCSPRGAAGRRAPRAGVVCRPGPSDDLALVPVVGRGRPAGWWVPRSSIPTRWRKTQYVHDW